MQLFGSGVMWGTATQDALGNVLATPQPVQFGALQDVAVDISFDSKLLYGQGQFAIDAARGKGKISIKPKFAQVNGALLNNLFFGQTTAAQLIGDQNDLTGTPIPAGPSTITPAVPNAGTWSADLGVRDSNAVPMTRVTTAPATGQYSVTAGVYTFAAADVGKTVYIAFQYTATSTTAKKGTIQSLVMGPAPKFRTDLSIPYGAKVLTLAFMTCVSSKLTLATKQDDYAIPEMDIDAIGDAFGNVGFWSISE
jgi:hypothetical protein